MRRRMFVVVAILTAIVFLNFNVSFAYEKEVKSISSAMSEKIARANKKTVAVVDFTDLQGNITELGRFMAEEFSVSFADMDKGFEVVDRTHLKTIIKEHNLATTGIIDPATAKKLGEIAGVDALVTGTITPFGDTVRLSLKILDTATAKVIGASSGEIAKTKAIEDLLAKGISQNEAGPAVKQVSQVRLAKATENKDMPFFRNDRFKITVKSLKNTDNILTLVLLYENITEKNISISLYGDRYLIDENGERWELKDVENLGDNVLHYGYTEFPPHLPKMVKMTFSPKDDPNGSTFNAVLHHDISGFGGITDSRFQAIIRDIKAE